MSLVDVGAGYDILSYENDLSKTYDRFIEVKSFHGKEHFYWSINEKNTSELLGEKYFLYLVDLDEYKENPNNYTPYIIQNPYKLIYNGEWVIEPTNFYIYKV